MATADDNQSPPTFSFEDDLRQIQIYLFLIAGLFVLLVALVLFMLTQK